MPDLTVLCSVFDMYTYYVFQVSDNGYIALSVHAEDCNGNANSFDFYPIIAPLYQKNNPENGNAEIYYRYILIHACERNVVTSISSATRCSNGVNSLSPSTAYMHRWIGSVLVQIMACRLFGAKPLSKPMLRYCQLDPWEQTSVKFWSNCKSLYSEKCIWKYRLRNYGHFV